MQTDPNLCSVLFVLILLQELGPEGSLFFIDSGSHEVFTSGSSSMLQGANDAPTNVATEEEEAKSVSTRKTFF